MKIAPIEKRLRTGEQILLRTPDRDDAPAVLTFIRVLSKEAFRNLNHGPDFFDAMTEQAEASFLGSVADHPKNTFIAAFAGDEVIGTAHHAVSPASFAQHCAALGIGVLAPHRKKGVGRLLLEALIDAAAEAGVWNLTLRVRTFNAPAIALYESLGFRRVGVLHRVAALPDGLADEYLCQREDRRGPPASHGA